LQAQLPAAGLDHRPEWDTDDGVIVVRVVDEQGLTPVATFAERIARERRDQEQLLTDAEQRVFEDALLGQLARQIHLRTIEARDLVDAMDTQMRARRMSSGITVGVGWRLSDDLDAEQREVCKLLEKDPARLGPAQLTTLRRHFAHRIKAARSVAPEKPYRELLADVLDYRQWRVFAFTLHRPGGTSEPLTRARHSQLSGGEQSVSLHLPLFAAANALFGSARPDAPRLLGLDEAFAGVDDTGRGELMSLAKQFDLDLFMTGYDLWATHPAVTGAAHYDLSHSAVDHTVSTILLVWDGAMNVADFDGTLARAIGSPETRRAPALADG
jgi:Putative exonuclease SbcCD, C subunit